MYKLEPLPYAYNALEPHIDEATMKLHHDKHHQTYVDKLNAAVEKHPELFEKEVLDLIKDLNAIPEDIRTAVRNHGGGVWNHNFFWNVMKTGTTPDGEVLKAIDHKFGSFDKFKEIFTNAALNQFGSGWAWLVVNKKGELEIISTSNQDSPVSQGLHPLLTIDVWEHSYYLRYLNKRNEYVAAFFNVINWDAVEKNYTDAIKKE